ncbi:MAG TPA: tetratricopeptide repeat protein [Gemmatimonadaceae bacterium]|nr:tetratricopeptide repeat protein [Gemmatimonadaceae bacterium]
MSPRLRFALLAGALFGLAGSTYAYAARRSPPPAPPLTALGPVRSEAEVRDLDIRFYAARAARDPTGAMDLARLAQLYLARSRETGDYSDVLRADSAARLSLHHRLSRNALAAQVLASSLLSEHRFADALDVARTLTALDPERVSYRAMCGEIEVELGRYTDARGTFDSLRTQARSLSVAPRLARWEEIEGRPEIARALLRYAITTAAQRPDLPSEQRAWMWLRLGDVELRTGRPDSAEHDYRAGLVAHPDDYRIDAALAHLHAVRHEWTAAIDVGNRAIATVLDPATLGTISDSYLALGDTARAAEFAHAMEVAVSKRPGAYHRAWSLFLLDHDRRVPEVLSKARVELRTRRDIYGYDVLAWALYRSGRYAEAQRTMLRALSQGTQDALLYFHNGMIERAAGHPDSARVYLQRALSTNPYFHPTQPDSARALLSELTRE